MERAKSVGTGLGVPKGVHRRAQCPKKQAADARKRQLVAAESEIEIVEELEKEKPVEN